MLFNCHKRDEYDFFSAPGEGDVNLTDEDRVELAAYAAQGGNTGERLLFSFPGKCCKLLWFFPSFNNRVGPRINFRICF